MSTRNFTILLSLTLFSFFTSEVMGQSSGGMNTARASIGKREDAPAGPMYTGNGGSDIRLAVFAPVPQGNGNIPDYLPLYIQGLLNANIKKFSEVNLIDRQNRDMIIAEQNLAASGRFSDRDFVSIGNMVNAQYLLLGTVQRLSGNRYSLQLSVTEASTGVIKASFMKDGTSAQFEENGAIINEATAELLEKLGVQLTAAGKQTLLAGNMTRALAETGVAKGITAQETGAEVRALFNYAQANMFNPSLEAESLLETLSTGISGGTISQQIADDMQKQKRWLEVFKETAKFYNEHPPFEIIFDPTLIPIRESNFTNYTADLAMRIALNPSETGFNALNTLLDGLEKTGRRSAWGFSNWPLTDITPRTAGTVLFNGKQTFNCKVNVSLLNDKNKTISTNTITLSTKISSSPSRVTIPDSVIGTVNFLNLKEEDLRGGLTIVITAVNGIQASKLNAGYMKIETGDLKKKYMEWEASTLLAQAQREEATRLAQAQKEEAARLVKAQKEKEEADRAWQDQWKREQAAVKSKQAIRKAVPWIIGGAVVAGLILLFVTPNENVSVH